jgi:hypothetical protein
MIWDLIAEGYSLSPLGIVGALSVILAIALMLAAERVDSKVHPLLLRAVRVCRRMPQDRLLPSRPPLTVPAEISTGELAFSELPVQASEEHARRPTPPLENHSAPEVQRC